jgi:hypothetical protein
MLPGCGNKPGFEAAMLPGVDTNDLGTDSDNILGFMAAAAELVAIVFVDFTAPCDEGLNSSAFPGIILLLDATDLEISNDVKGLEAETSGDMLVGGVAIADKSEGFAQPIDESDGRKGALD